MGNQPNNERQVIRWVKTAGTLRLRDGRRVEAGQEFLAHPDEIPRAFRDTVRPVNPLELENLLQPPLTAPPAAPIYKIVPGGLPGRFRVVDGRGKVVSEKPLSADEAAKYVEQLTAG